MLKCLQLLTIALVVCATLGCKKNHAPDNNPLTDSVKRRPTLPIAVPEGTALLLRMNPADFDRGVEAITTVDGKSLLRLPPDKKLSQVLLTVLLSHNQMRSVSAMSDPAQVMFDGLDMERSIFAALSVAGNEPFINSLEMRAPGDISQDIYRGMFVRLYLPAKQPAKLQGWFEENCEALAIACKYNFKATPGKDHLLLDYRLGDVPELFEYLERDPRLPTPPNDDDFITESTASLEAFAYGSPALGVHVRSERIADIGALLGMKEALDAIQSATPETKAMLYYRGQELAGGMYTLLSPGSREFADSTTLVRFEGLAMGIDAIFGYTELGQKIAKKKTAVHQSAGVGGGSMITLDLDPQWSTAGEAAIVPDWLAGSNKQGREVATDLMRNSGIWAYLLTLHNYPYALFKGIGGLAPSISGEVDHVHGAFDVVPATGGPAPFTIEGGLVVTLAPSADPKKTMTFFGYLFNSVWRLPTSKIEIANSKESPAVHLTFGNATFTDPHTLPQGSTASVDLARISEVFGGLGAPPDMTGLLRALEQATYNSKRTPNVLHHSVRFGTGKLEPITLSEHPMPRAVTSKRYACLAPLRDISREAQRSISRGTPHETSPVLALIQKLKEAEATCPEEAAMLRMVRGRWLRWLGEQHVKLLDWPRALAAFDASCKLGEVTGCRWQEVASSYAKDLVPTRVQARAREDFFYRELSGTILTPTAFYRPSVITLTGLSPFEKIASADIDWANEEGQRELGEFADISRTSMMVVHPATPAHHVARLANLIKSPGAKRARREQELLRTGSRFHMLLFDASGQPLAIEVVPSSDTDLRLEIAISAEGIDLLSGGKRVQPLDGCTKITVCPEDNLAALLETMNSTTGTEQAEAARKVVEAMRAPVIEELINPDKLPDTIRITVDERIPFAVFAEVIAQIQAQAPKPIAFEIHSKWVDGL